ncbi:hypothetical protein [Mycobacterium sp.]|jgi:hypothetical protein|uniref:hypothetical protein n=1 Tax=Mycobacterium sp. TaxID=1785 RepID=UPI002D3B5A0B|nr:hypothetical protein [Mycobacterium sp.]HZA12502.1 hypothetical protein [Mycobacterium sp.]
MDHPDTIVEVHREHVQDQTLQMFSREQQSQSVSGPGYAATATLDLTLDRVWFVSDSHARAWQEQTGGDPHDPLRHFAIDLVLFDSKIHIDSITCIPLVPLPPRTVTIPDGPRAGEARRIPYNEIPLLGRVTIHDQLERRQIEPGKATICLNFAPQDAPVLVAAPPPDRYGARLFGPGSEPRSSGDIAFTGQDPRITWDLDYAEAYWITHCIAGELLVNLEKVRHLGISDDGARTAVLDFVAAQIAEAVRRQLAEMGDDGVVNVLPMTLEIDPDARDDSTVKALDAVVQRYDVGGETHESMVVQLQTLRELPAGEQVPASVLADRPHERIAVAVTGWSILRQVRGTVMNSFGLAEGDFDAEEPCLLNGPKTITIGGAERCLDSLTADIIPRTGDGRLMVDGKVSAHTALYDFDATFTVTLEMVLDEIPQGADELEDALRAASERKRRGEDGDEDSDDSDESYEAEVKRVKDAMDELPRTIGVRPRLNPPEPVVNPDFSLTAAGHAAAAVGVTAIVGMLAFPVTWVAGAAGVTAASAGGLLTLAIAQYIATVITIDWFGTGIGFRQVRKSLADRPGGTLLPSVGIPIDVNLDRKRLAVYFRPLLPHLVVDCVRTDDDGAVRLIGGKWPTDGKPWKMTTDDAALYVDSGELELFVGDHAIQVSPQSAKLRGLPHCDEAAKQPK